MSLSFNLFEYLIGRIPNLQLLMIRENFFEMSHQHKIYIKI